MSLACEQQWTQGSGGENRFDDYARGEDGLRAQRRGAQPLQVATRAVDHR